MAIIPQNRSQSVAPARGPRAANSLLQQMAARLGELESRVASLLETPAQSALGVASGPNTAITMDAAPATIGGKPPHGKHKKHPKSVPHEHHHKKKESSATPVFDRGLVQDGTSLYGTIQHPLTSYQQNALLGLGGAPTWPTKIFATISFDGNALHTITTSATQNVNQIGYDFQHTLFVAVGQAGSIMWSHDGLTWINRTSGTALNLFDVIWNPQLGLWCAVGGDGAATAVVLTSPDGITWTARTSNLTASATCVATSGATFFVGANTGQYTTSPDGITWTAGSIGTDGFIDVVWANEIGAYCIVAGIGNFYIGADGGAVPYKITPTGISGITSSDFIEWSGTQFLLGGSNTPTSAAILTSPDFYNWTLQTLPTTTPATNTTLAGAWFGTNWIISCNTNTTPTFLFRSDPTGSIWTPLNVQPQYGVSALIVGQVGEIPSITAFDATAVLGANVPVAANTPTTVLSTTIIIPPGGPHRITVNWFANLQAGATVPVVWNLWVTDGTNKWAAHGAHLNNATQQTASGTHGHSSVTYAPGTSVTVTLTVQSTQATTVLAAAAAGGPNTYMHIATEPSN